MVVLKGKIADKGNAEWISNAVIQIEGASNHVVSDINGDFKLVVKEQFPIALSVSAFGYEPLKFLVKSKSASVFLQLSQQHILGKEIVVSASRISESILESPVAVERIGVADVQKSAAASFYDGLVNLKGVEQSTQSFTFKSLNTRGFNANGNVRFNQFVDGMDNQAPGLNFSVGNIVGVSDLDLESAELLPGSSSALYGAGGINGTLLLNSKNPFKYEGLSLQLKTGINHVDSRQNHLSNWNDMQFRYAKSWNNKFAFKVNFSYLMADDWQGQDYSNFDRKGMRAKPGDRNSDPAYDGVNVYGDEIRANMRNVAQAVVSNGTDAYISQYQFNTGLSPTAAQIQDFLNTDPVVSPFYKGLQAGVIPDQDVSRTGYAERDLVDYNTESIRTSASFNYKMSSEIEAVGQIYWGTGTSAYTGADRYALRNFKLGQYKLELTDANFS